MCLHTRECVGRQRSRTGWGTRLRLTAETFHPVSLEEAVNKRAGVPGRASILLSSSVLSHLGASGCHPCSQSILLHPDAVGQNSFLPVLIQRWVREQEFKGCPCFLNTEAPCCKVLGLATRPPDRHGGGRGHRSGSVASTPWVTDAWAARRSPAAAMHSGAPRLGRRVGGSHPGPDAHRHSTARREGQARRPPSIASAAFCVFI